MGAKIQVSGLGIDDYLLKSNFVVITMNPDQSYIICVVGAESSGKTTLARQLADYYACLWVPEYAREYLSNLARPYDLSDLEKIASVQLERIRSADMSQQNSKSKYSASKLLDEEGIAIDDRLCEKYRSVNAELIHRIDHLKASGSFDKLIIVDGGMMTLRMWARIKFDKTIPVVEEELKRDITSLYILCRPFVDWEPDPLREAPALLDRVWIYNRYLNELVKSGKVMLILNADNSVTPEV
jgi:nicotinamide riboside kinase